MSKDNSNEKQIFEKSIGHIEDVLGKNDDQLVRRFNVFGEHPATLVCFSNMVELANVNTDILKPLMYVPRHLQDEKIDRHRLKDVLFNDVLFHSDGKLEDWEKNCHQSVDLLYGRDR